MTSYLDTRIAAIRALVHADLYVVDARSVAEAILTRRTAARLIPGTTFRGSLRALPPVRSFRRSGHVRSFRPCGAGDRLRSRR